MSELGARGRKRRGGNLFALVVLVICAYAAYWSFTTLFPAELQQTGQWLQAKFEALLR